MEKLAIVYGGDSLEHDISIITAFLVMKNCQLNKRPYVMIYLSREGAFYCGKALEKKENYLSLRGFHQGHFIHHHKKNYFVTRWQKIAIESCLLCVHGAHSEDGSVGAIFDTLKIPSTFSSVENASILQNKYLTKMILKEIDIPIVPSVLVKKQQLREHRFDIETLISSLNPPYIVKPVHLGSSIGVYKCQNNIDIQKVIPTLWHLDSEIIIEEVVSSLHEYNIAIVGDERELFLSDIEEVNKENEVLSFHDKYEEFSGHNQKQIPAFIDEKLEKKIQEYAKKAFVNLNCVGVVRFDFLYNDQTNQLFLNEINTIPGSLAYYLFESKGMSFNELISLLIDISLYQYEKKKNYITTYQDSNLLTIMDKK